MKAWKEDTTSGSNHLVGAAPTVGGSAGSEWLMTWKTDLTSMDAFIAGNKAAGVGKKQT
jgi:hypothetical protein